MATFRITIRVKPGSSQARVGGSYGDTGALLVSVHAQPVDGGANSAVIAAVASALGVHKADVEVAGGHTSRAKILAIETNDADSLQLRLEELLKL